MNTSTLIFVIAFLALFSYWFAIQRTIKLAGGLAKVKRLTSLPRQFGTLTAFWCGLPALIVLLIWSIFETSVVHSILLSSLTQEVNQLPLDQLSLYLNDIHVIAAQITDGELIRFDEENLKHRAARYLVETQVSADWMKSGLVLLVCVCSVLFIVSRFTADFQARVKMEKIIGGILWASSGVALLTTVGIILSVLFESIQFFSAVPPLEFLFGTEWSPQIAMRSDQVGGSGAFGAIPLFAGTLLITAIAMLLSIPTGLMIAIYLSQYASERLRSIAKPMLEILAGVPTVVYGFFAALTVAPLIRDFGGWLGLSVASESALAAGLVMGIMIIPFISSLSDDAISAVPKSLKEGSLGLGATPSETIKKVLLPAAVPGIVGAILLALSRAIGETMIVVMAAGMAANLTANPLESVTTVTVQIVTLLTGDQEFDSPKTLAAFALGLMLFVTTLALNIIALKVVRKYREQYD
ncbi:MAG: phosphate ABC transporter permease subunit PstC [Kangiellaceae bacterium]|nr:phosphate ABC transporter permease subunit PstC [Kangiellaceae bacterium]